MNQGGWKAFREAGKSKVLTETAVAELERPAVVSHRIGIAPSLQGPEPDGEEPLRETEGAAAEDEKADDEVPPDIAPWTPDAPEILHKPSYGAAAFRGIGHWSVLAIVPVAAAASLLAVRAGVNPYALCLEWWDFLFGSIFLAACLMFLGLAIWKPPMGRWHPGAPALIVVVAVLPLWAGSNAAFGSACRTDTASPHAALVPPLPPLIIVPSLILSDVPMPEPRPAELHYMYRADKTDPQAPDLKRSVLLQQSRM